MGGVATGPGGRAWHGRGVAPGAAVAAMKLVVSTAEQERAGETTGYPSCSFMWQQGNTPQTFVPSSVHMLSC